MKANFKKFLEAINFRINSGSSDGWKCFGPNAFILDYLGKNSCASATFDTNNQFLYEISACDYVGNKAYKWISPKYIKNYEKKLKLAGIKKDEAWDSVVFEKISFEKMIKILKKITK